MDELIQAVAANRRSPPSSNDIERTRSALFALADRVDLTIWRWAIALAILCAFKDRNPLAGNVVAFVTEAAMRQPKAAEATVPHSNRPNQPESKAGTQVSSHQTYDPISDDEHRFLVERGVVADTTAILTDER